jgi:hypothetical protein
METNEESNSDHLISIRDEGQWKSLCKKGCTKGDDSVYLQADDMEVTLDFRFKTMVIKLKIGDKDESPTGKCELLN